VACECRIASITILSYLTAIEDDRSGIGRIVPEFVIVGGKVVRSISQELPEARLLCPRVTIVADKFGFQFCDLMRMP
jgi:hypothetical protein